MKLSSFTALLLASTAQPATAFFDEIFGGGEATGSGGKGVFYLNERSANCFVKVDGAVESPGDYGSSNNNLSPGLACIGAVCNTGGSEGAVGINMDQGDDDNDRTTFSDVIRVSCYG